jgi:hypothetical protein
LGEEQEYRLPTEEQWKTIVGTNKYLWGNQWPPPRGTGNFAGLESKAGAPADWAVITNLSFA